MLTQDCGRGLRSLAGEQAKQTSMMELVAIYERFRQGRHAAQYFDPSKAEKTRPDAGWALSTAGRALSQTRAVIDGGTIELY